MAKVKLSIIQKKGKGIKLKEYDRERKRLKKRILKYIGKNKSVTASCVGRLGKTSERSRHE